MGNEQSGQDAERKSSSSKKNNKQEKSDVFHYSNVTGVTHRALSRSSPNNKNRQNNEDWANPLLDQLDVLLGVWAGKDPPQKKMLWP